MTDTNHINARLEMYHVACNIRRLYRVRRERPARVSLRRFVAYLRSLRNADNRRNVEAA